MLLSTKVELKWNSKIKKHYEELGYMYTKMGEIFEVKVNDLTNGSQVFIDVKCDYCGKTYKKHWSNYLQENNKSIIHKDSCTACKSLKARESVQYTYGYDNVFQLEGIKNKICETNNKKYGVDNPFQSEEIKGKIRNTNLSKYGFESAMQSNTVKEKRKKYCIEKYNLPYMPQLKITHQKGELSPRWNGGALRNNFYRSTYQYRDWHDFVLKRDEYSCQCCGNKNGNGHKVQLHAHHIYNFADNKDLIHSNDNGICLCKECHIKFHSIYGRRNTTKSQLSEFILNYGKKIC